MAGVTVPGYRPSPPAGYGGGGGQPVDPNRGQMRMYRQDAGRDMSDAEYTRWQQQQSRAPLNDQRRYDEGRLADQRKYDEQQKARQQEWLKSEERRKFGYESQGREQVGRIGREGETHGAGLQAAAELRRLQMFKPYMDQFTKFNEQTAGGAGTQPATIEEMSSPAEDAARQAAFARAKDQAGMIGRSAMTALNNTMGARGLAGSKFAQNAAGGVVNTGATQLGEVNREQMIQDLQNARQRASEVYQGNIAQRGQNIQDQASRRAALTGLLSGMQGNITARY